MIEESRNESFKESEAADESRAAERPRLQARSGEWTLDFTMEVTSDLC